MNKHKMKTGGMILNKDFGDKKGQWSIAYGLFIKVKIVLKLSSQLKCMNLAQRSQGNNHNLNLQCFHERIKFSSGSMAM